MNIREKMEQQELELLSPYAACSVHSRGRERTEEECDVSLEPGIIRVRKKGSAGGHNGLKNIIQHLGKDQFVRIKVGVGEKPAGYDLADYVLGHFDREEQVLMKQVSEEVCEAVQMILEKGPDAAMNVYNGRKVEKA